MSAEPLTGTEKAAVLDGELRVTMERLLTETA